MKEGMVVLVWFFNSLLTVSGKFSAMIGAILYVEIAFILALFYWLDH